MTLSNNYANLVLFYLFLSPSHSLFLYISLILFIFILLLVDCKLPSNRLHPACYHLLGETPIERDHRPSS